LANRVPEVTIPMFDELERWLRLSAERLRDQAQALTALDQAIGDGDHGINMDRGFTAIVAALDAGVADAESDQARAGGMLRTAGRTLISTVGGAAGPLYGTALVRGSGALIAADPSTSSAVLIVAVLDAAIGGVTALGKATSGEKTMLDALMPALDAGRAALDADASAAELARAMADAAEAGALATVPMLATKGRASYLGERSIGHQDPGATSSALLLRALADVAAA
jgi:dihydroxyacetone kinase-like protein